jgi:hypothetical protein
MEVFLGHDLLIENCSTFLNMKNIGYCNLTARSGKAVPYAHHEADKEDKVKSPLITNLILFIPCISSIIIRLYQNIARGIPLCRNPHNPSE